MFHLICNPQPAAPAVKPLAEQTIAEMIASIHVLNVSTDHADTKAYNETLNALYNELSRKDYLSLLDDLEAALDAVL